MPFIARNHEQSCFTSPLPTPYWSAMQSACVSRTVSTDSKQPNSSRSNSSEEEVVEGSKKPTTVDLSDVVAKVRNHLNNPSFGCAKYSQVGDYGFNYIPIRERLRENHVLNLITTPIATMTIRTSESTLNLPPLANSSIY